MGQCNAPKRRYLPTELQCVTSQTTVIFDVQLYHDKGRITLRVYEVRVLLHVDRESYRKKRKEKTGVNVTEV
jgi:hypothetical protein